MARDGARPKPKPQRDCSWCGLLSAKVVLCVMNVCSFGLAAGLVAVGSKKVRFPMRRAVRRAPRLRRATCACDVRRAAVRSCLPSASERLCSAAQVSYGGVRTVLDAVGKRHLLLDPYVTLVTMGGVLMPLSALGFWAAVSGWRRTLFMFFCSVLLVATALVYVSALCFVYAASEAATSQLVQSYWSLVSAALEQEEALYDTSRAQAVAHTAAKLLTDAGRMCIASAVFMLVALVCASRIAGHSWMMSRVGLAVNLLSTVLGAAVVYAASLTSHYNLGGDWAADFLGGIGGFIMIASLVGLVATAMRWRVALWAHFLSLCALAILLTAATCVILVYGSSRVSEFARTGAGKVPAVFRTRVLGCVSTALPVNATAADFNATALNLTNAEAAAVLQCAVDPEEAQRFWETHLTVLGALGSVLLVVLLANLVSAGYLLYNGPDEEAPAGRKKKGAREKQRRRRRRDDSDDNSSDEGESVQLARRSSKRSEEEP